MQLQPTAARGTSALATGSAPFSPQVSQAKVALTYRRNRTQPSVTQP